MRKALLVLMFMSAYVTCWGFESMVTKGQVQSAQTTDSTLVNLHFNIIGGTLIPRPKFPALFPNIVQNCHTLYLENGCDDTVLAIVDNTDEALYTLEIEAGCESTTLPDWLTGNYKLHIIRGSLIFEAEIEL